MSILIFIIILLVLVLVHESGHFFTAKGFGIRVDEFGFGFPPKLYGKKYGETEYTINVLPFGGFVKIFGENPDEENTNGPEASRSFVNKPKWQQAIVLFAGIFSNFLLACVLFSIVFMMGSPLATDSIPAGAKEQMKGNLVILAVSKDSPAEKAGLKQGDIVLSAQTSTEKITDPDVEKFVSFSNKPNQNINILFTRNGKENSVNLVPQENKDLGRAFIGISPGILLSGKFGFFESIKYGFETAALSFKDTFVAFGKLFKGGEESKQIRDSVVGPIGLIEVTGIIFKVGFGYLLSFVAVISISLAAVNLIPFPALDGGRLLFLLIEKIKGSKLNPKFANTANMVGFAILIILMLLVTYHDVIKLF
ncbi:MAG: RIP metalloprotease RseP [bacterium]